MPHPLSALKGSLGFPECLPVVASWTIAATRSLEASDRKSWPQNGLKFATSVVQTMLSFGNQVCPRLGGSIGRLLFAK